ncbi:MAG: hypothetical protein V7459_00900 [Oceanicoccus sp.]
MARVIFPDEIEKLIGENNLMVDARVFRDVVTELIGRYPELKESSLDKMAVAIDDVIVVDPLLEPINSDSDIYFFHFVTGG